MMIRVNRAADKVVISMLGTIERWDAADTAWIVSDAGQLPVEVRLDSPGGDPMAALSIGQMLASLPQGFTCFVEGLCLSAAPLIAMRAKRIVAAETAMFMIHGASFEPWRNLDNRDLENASEMVRVVNETMGTLISARTGKTVEDVKALLEKDTWYTAQEALDNKLVDEVVALERVLPVQPFSVAAHFKNVPATILASLPDHKTQNQTPNMSKTLLDRVRAAFGLNADADEVDAALKLQAQLDTAKAQKEENDRLRSEIEQLKQTQPAAGADAKDAEVATLVADAVKKFQLKASEEANVKATYKGNPDGLKAVLALIPEGAHKPGFQPKAPGSDKKVSARYVINDAVNQAFGELK